MNSATKVGEIFLAAGTAYSKLGEVGPENLGRQMDNIFFQAIMSLHPAAAQLDGLEQGRQGREEGGRQGREEGRREGREEGGEDTILPDVNLMLSQQETSVNRSTYQH